MLRDIAPVRASERIPAVRSRGRIAANDLNAPINLPPFRSSAMDGYALRLPATGDALGLRLRVVGTSSAGHPYNGTIAQDGCIRILTGAAVPESLDTVVIQEDCDRNGDWLTIKESLERGANIRAVGHDITAGAVVLTSGTSISPFDQAWLAACGITELDVIRRPRVGIFSTGDELREPGSPLAAGQIYDANRHALRALLSDLPIDIEDLGILPDDLETLGPALAEAGATCDAVITSGGVSVGDADLVRLSLEQQGKLAFWKLNLKPGKPLAFGRLGRAIFIGLPGNPVSTLVTALLLARPVLLRLCSGSPQETLSVSATLLDDIEHRPGREEYQRGWLETRDGTATVRVAGDQSSNRLASFANANCLIQIPKAVGDVTSGSLVAVLPFNALL